MRKVAKSSKQSSVKHDAFRARMKAQCYQITEYRAAMLRDQGRRLSHDEAGLEWIELYAEAFAQADDDS